MKQPGLEGKIGTRGRGNAANETGAGTLPPGVHYNELEIFELESKMRKVVSHLMDPVLSQQSADRAEYIRF